MRLLLLAVLALACNGCIRSVAERGTGWWRVQTDHVRLATDVDHDRAVTAAWAFEDLYRALASVFPACEGTGTGEPIDVTMIARGNEYDAIAPRDTSGFYQHERVGLVGSPAQVVVRAENERGRGHYTQIFLHELTHRFVSACFPGARTWLNEGLATFFETLRVAHDELIVGLAPYHFAGLSGVSSFVADGILMIQIGRSLLRPPSRTIVSSPGDFTSAQGGDPTAAYASAWALVHMSMLANDDGLRDAFLAYLDALHRGGSLELESHPERLDAALQAYVDGGQLRARHVPYTPAPLAEPEARAMSPGEAHLLLAALGPRRRADSTERRDARAHVALALEDPSTHAVAELVRLEMRDLREGETSDSILSTLLSTYPDDVHVLAVRAMRAIGENGATNEARAVLDALEARTDLRGREQRLACQLAAILEDWPSMLAHARALVTATPGDAAAHELLARALSAVGDTEGALRERRFGQMAPDTGALVAADQPGDEFDWNFPEGSPPQRVPEGPVPDGPAPDGPAPDATHLALSAAGTTWSGITQLGGPAASLGAFCVGFVPRTPAAVFDVPVGAPPFVVEVEGRETALVVEAADHRVACAASGFRSAVRAAWPPGPMRVFVGSITGRSGDAYTLIVGRDPGAFVAPLFPPACSRELGPPEWIRLGMRVRLGRHRAWTSYGAPNPIRDDDWAVSMDAFVGRPAVITAIAGVDSAGCTTVHVDVDGGHWLWRARDLAAP